MLKILILSFLSFVGGINLNGTDPIDLTKTIYGVFRDQSFVCGGVLAGSDSTTNYIITAAHCLYRVQTSRVSVVLGKGVHDSSSSIPARQIFIHPYYNPPIPEFDIAVIKIKKPTSGGVEIQKTTNDGPFVVKWESPLGGLSAVPFKAEDRVTCRKKLEKYFYVSDKMLCGYYDAEGVLDGGPLMKGQQILGITSYRVKKDNGALPVIFTNMANSDIINFINNILPLKL